MTINYTIKKENVVEYQLYGISKLHKTKRARERNLFVPIVILVTLGLFLLLVNNPVATIVLVVVSIFWYLLYPRYESKRYREAYEKSIGDTHKNQFDKTVSIRLEDDFIYTLDNSGNETKTVRTELFQLIETARSLFLQGREGQALVFPKDELKDEQIQFVKSYCLQHNIAYLDEQTWSWR